MDKRQAKDLSIYARLLLEKCFEAFIDAGEYILFITFQK